jgi:exodeoxyribonuclease V beta subunit
LQAEQENRRLLYVALTRAKYHCFITTSKQSSKSCLRKFTNQFIAGDPRNGVEVWIPPAFNRSYRYQITGGKSLPKYSEPVRFNLLQKNWRKTSYSGLNPEHAIISYPYNDAPFLNTYDEFVFRNLKKGAQTGDLLHYIFERIDFADSTYWKTTVDRALKRHGYPNDDAHGENIVKMIEHVIEAGIPSSAGTFSLNKVGRDNRLSELEFDFHLDEFGSEQLIDIFSTSPTPIGLKKFDELEGIMNGKIDLFFRHDGKYYILDWKSNFLGGKTEDYSNEHLWRAMEENNYHLQYHIYIIALCKYLSLRVPGFSYEKDFGGVIYLFLRGVLKDRPEGIFYHKPDVRIVDSLHNLLTPEKVTS